MNNFMDNLCYTHVALLSDGSLEELTAPAQKGKQRLAGVDINKKRNLAVMECVLALAIKPNGYQAKDIAALMKQRLDKKQAALYSPGKAAYDIRKLRGKGLVEKAEKTRIYKTTPKGVRTIVSVLSITQKMLPALLSSVNKTVLSKKPEEMSEIDGHYIKIKEEISALCEAYRKNVA
jgi:DNA-binding PadR family transcriptional regulator